MHIIKSVQTSLKILTCFSSGSPVLGVTEIARQLRLTKSTTSRILSTLEQTRFVAKIADGQKYRLGSKIAELAGVFLSGHAWRTVAIPHMRALRDATGETVTLFAMDGDHRICLEGCESAQELRPSFSVGGRYPLHAGSAGKLLLAYVSPEDRKRVLARAGLAGYTSQTITRVDDLERALAEIRRKGYAVSHQERAAFLSSVSAPIRDFRGDVMAAVCVYGPSVRFTGRKVAAFTRLARAAGMTISQEIGFGCESARTRVSKGKT